MGNGQIKSVAIIGAGTMGTRIAYRCAISGIKCTITDKYPELIQKSLGTIRTWFIEKTNLPKWKMEEASIDLVNTAETIEKCVSDVDLVIETVSENLELKRKVFAEIDKYVSSKTIIATNSSSLRCSDIADATSRPEKIFNVNFSDPTHDDEVELMKGKMTSDETLILGEQFCRELQMIPIVTLKEIMGFSFNRIWRAIKKESLHLVNDGFSDHQDIDRAFMLCFGTTFGPFGLMDIVGLDVIRDVEMQYYLDTRDESDKPPALLDRMIAEGKLGVKSQKGFYDYPNPSYKNPNWIKKAPPFEDDLFERLASIRNK